MYVSLVIELVTSKFEMEKEMCFYRNEVMTFLYLNTFRGRYISRDLATYSSRTFSTDMCTVGPPVIGMLCYFVHMAASHVMNIKYLSRRIFCTLTVTLIKNITAYVCFVFRKASSGRPGAAAILHRPAIKTIGQSSNHSLVKGTKDQFLFHHFMVST